MRFALLIPLMLLNLFGLCGCQTTYVWDLGYPDKGDDASQFELESMDHTVVVSHGKRYTRETFAPIVRHAVPEVLAPLAEADRAFELEVLFTSGTVATLSYVVPEDWPKYVERLRDGVVIAEYVAVMIADLHVRNRYKAVVRLYNKALSRRLAGRP